MTPQASIPVKVTHHDQVKIDVNTFPNANEILTIPVDIKDNWKNLHDSFITNGTRK